MILHRDDVARRWVDLCVLAASCVLLYAPHSQAQISFVELRRSGFYSQTGNGNTLTLSGYQFAASLFSVNPGDFSGGLMTYPGPSSPANLSSAGPMRIDFGTLLFANKAAIDAAFPTGTYSFVAGDTSLSDSTSLSYTGDFFPQSLPYLDGTTYADLQGMNPQVPFTVDFSPFQTGPGVSASFISFTLFDLTDEFLTLDASFLSPSTAELVLPANTLQPGHDYQYQLIFLNRVLVDSPGAELPGQLRFDFRTTGAFTTAVPEPAGLCMLAVAGIGLLGRRRNR